MISSLLSLPRSRSGFLKNASGRAVKTAAVLIVLAIVFQAFMPADVNVSATGLKNTAASWTLYQVDSYHNFLNLTDRSLKFDSNGHPHIAYGGKNLYYAYFDGTNWQRVVVDPASGVGEYAAIALDKNNLPRISYYDEANRSLKFAFFNGSFWTTMTVDTPGNNIVDLAPENLHRLNPGEQAFAVTADQDEAVGMYSSIAVDSNNEIHITYYNTYAVNPNNTPGIIKYAHWDGVTWDVGTIIDSRNNTGKYTSVAIRPNDQAPCVSYLNEKYDDLMYACRKGDGSWNPEAVDEPGNVGAFTSLAFDTSSNPHISYYDFGSKDLKYAVKNSGSWGISTLATSGDIGQFTSIAVRGSDNRIYISYVDQTDNKIKIANSSGWSGSTVQSLAGDGRYTSVAIDKNGRPGMVYYSVENATLYYAYHDGSKWVFTALDVSGDLGLGSSVDANNFGLPFVSYQNATSLDLKYARIINNNWTAANILASGYDVGGYTSLKLDSKGRPVIAYYDAGAGDLKLASWNGSVWELRTVDASDDVVGLYLSLALDSSDRPHISYYNASQQDLKYAFWTGSAWDVKVVDFAGDVGQYTGIALDSSNRPFISYYDATNGDLKMAYKSPTDSWITYPAVDEGGNVGQYTSIAIDPAGYPRISYYDATNGDLKVASMSGGGWSIETVSSNGNTGLYTSIVVDSSYDAHISYYDASAGDLMYANGYTGNWVIQLVASDGVVGLFSSIALNGADQPVISYYDYTAGELWVAMSYPIPEPIKVYVPHLVYDD